MDKTCWTCRWHRCRQVQDTCEQGYWCWCSMVGDEDAKMFNWRKGPKPCSCGNGHYASITSYGCPHWVLFASQEVVDRKGDPKWVLVDQFSNQ